MLYIIIAVFLLGLTAAMFGNIHNRRLQKKIDDGTIESLPDVKAPDPGCCGAHEICEKESLLAAVSKEIEYYDDEELDEFRNRPSDQYTEEEITRFSEVFYTLAPTEVAGWVRSLQLRGILLPDPLKDEVILVIGERRSFSTKKKVSP